MEFFVLGPVDVVDDGRRLNLGGTRQRALFALLLLHANEVVSVDRLGEELWAGRPPASVGNVVQQSVSRLRRALGPDRIETRSPGYLVRVKPGELDLERFEGLLEQGRELLAGGAAFEAGEALRAALGLWQGPALAGFEFEGWAANEIDRLEALRLAALELRLQADLALGLHAEAVSELTGLVRDHPLRETLRGLLMVALYRSGRQADALAAYQEGRTALVEDLGLDPSETLQHLEKQILQHHPALDLVIAPLPTIPVLAPVAVPVATDAPAEVRKTVTVLFCDIVEDGKTDPEALRRVLARCAELATTVVERHGGTIEQLVGGGMMALFGIPAVHEDDALRAVRTAVEIRDMLPNLGVQTRIGIDSGEVITGGNASMTGSVITAGQRLGAAAAAGELLIGELTASLIGDVAELERLALDDAERQSAYRVHAVRGAAERDHGMHFVGRQRELALISEAWERIRSEQRCELFTVVGEAGVGKTRLAAELLGAVEAQVVRGRCLPYGEAITYWPIVEMLNQLESPIPDEAAGATIRSLLGEVDSIVTADEIAWAFRKTLEYAAVDLPLIAVFDDIQWAEETLLDLIEHVALLSAGAPILLICMARPELAERRPSWPVTLRLEPLSDEQVDELLPARIAAGLRGRIARAAGGNPLFVQEMLAMADEDNGEVAVPPTLHALLTARLEQLEPGERSVLGRGAIEGEVFHWSAVQALAPDEPPMTSGLASLVRKGLIRPDRTDLTGEDAYRFRHLLIRDTAYDALPKGTRADLHERFASWLEVHGAELVSLDELLGHHLEQSYRYLTELEPLTDATRALGARAADRLAPAGRRALARGDLAACVSLLERALALGIADSRERTRARVDLAYALGETGRMAESDAMLAASSESDAGPEEHSLALRALVQRWSQRLVSDLDLDPADVVPVAQAAVDTFEQLDDISGVALAERLLAIALANAGRSRESRHVLEQAFVHAEASGDEAVIRRIIGALSFSMSGGPHGAWPVDEAIDRCHELLRSGRYDRVLEAVITRSLSLLLAMAGRIDEAREHVRQSSLVLDELNQVTVSSMYRRTAADALELIGDRAGAEQELTARYRDLRNARGGAPYFAPSGAEDLAQFYCDEGRWDEAADCLSLYPDIPEGAFYRPVIVTRLVVEARLAAHRGQLAEALTLVQRAVDLAAPTENLDVKAKVQLALAEVARRSGRSAEADTAVEAAILLYVQRGNITAAGRLRAARTTAADNEAEDASRNTLL